MDYKSLYFERKKHVLELLGETMNFYITQNNADKSSALNDLMQSVEKGTFSIVVVGQFSSGKSTFLNALMGEKYLPSFTTETTATINFLRSVKESPTQKPLIKINYKDGNCQLCEEVTLENIEKYVSTKGDDVAKKILSVEVFLDSEFLNDGVSLVDSPGLNGILEGHEQITNEQIDRSHAAIFMFNAKQPGSKSDFEKLKLLTDKCDSVLIVLNQRDVIKTDEETIEDVIAKLKENYGKWFHTTKLPEIYAISSYQALVARSSRDLSYNNKTNLTAEEKEELLDESAIDQFETRLLKYLTQGEKAQKELLGPVEKVIYFLNDSKDRVLSNIAELEIATDADEIRMSINQLHDELKSLNLNLNNSKVGLDQKLYDLVREIEDDIKAETEELKSECISKVSSAEDLEELESNAQIYISRIQSKFYSLFEKSCSKIERAFYQLVKDNYMGNAREINDRWNSIDKNDEPQLVKVSLDDSKFNVDVDIDNLMQRRNEYLADLDKKESRLDSLEIEMIHAKHREAQRESLQKMKERIHEQSNAEIKGLGTRPDVSYHTDYKNEKVGGVKGFFKWIWTGNRMKQVPIEVTDTSSRDQYDEERQRIEAEKRAQIDECERKLNAIQGISSAQVELEKRSLLREIERKEAELRDLEEQYRKKCEKARKKQEKAAKSYVEGIVDDLQKDNIDKIITSLRNSKDMMSDVILDVVQLQLTDAIKRKEDELAIREKQLSSSQEEKSQLMQNLKATADVIDGILLKANDYANEIKEIETDKIEVS